MAYRITDTDIVNISELSNADYQLYYGVFHALLVGGDKCEDNLYNLAASLINEYQAPMLRAAKIRSWLSKLQSLVLSVKEQEKRHKNENLRFVIPFYSDYDRAVTELVEAIDFIRGILDDMSKDTTGTYEIHPSDSFVFPLKDMKYYLTELQSQYQIDAQHHDELFGKTDDNYYWAVYYGIDWEIFRRGLDNYDDPEYSLDESYADAYRAYFFRSNYTGLDQLDSSGKTSEEVKELPVKLRTGVLLYMLESLGVKDREAIRKIVHFALKYGKEPYSAKTNSSDTIYSYLHNEKQLVNLTNEIQRILNEYGIEIPAGLKELARKDLV